ncbi:unnamed protein product, partial [Rotaria magnacalcarata]
SSVYFEDIGIPNRISISIFAKALIFSIGVFLGYWLAYKDGVYDITSYVENHPGGKMVLRSAGKALEACWKIFTMHDMDHVYEILEEYRIGNSPPGEREANQREQEKITDLFQYDPERLNIKENFFVRSKRPFNAETKPSVL